MTPEIDTRFGYQPPEKHLFGKMVHDILESINALLGWSRMGEELKLTDDFPEPARAWLLRNAPILQQERAHIYALSANFLNQTETLDAWLGLQDEEVKVRYEFPCCMKTLVNYISHLLHWRSVQ